MVVNFKLYFLIHIWHVLSCACMRWKGSTKHTSVYISKKKITKFPAFPLPATVPYNIVDVSKRLFS